MNEIEYSVDIKKDLVTQFQDQPKLDALLSVIQKQFDDLNEFLAELRVKRWLGKVDDFYLAMGEQLDRIGDIVCLSRGEAGYLACLDNPKVDVLSDEDYRKFLIFKIWKNTNTCTYYDVVKVFKMFWSKPLLYHEEPDKPATMLFETEIMKPFEMDVEELFRIPIVRAAGVGIYITAVTQADPVEYTIYPDSHLGGNLIVTHVPEEARDWSRVYELFLSPIMARWTQTIEKDNRTTVGLVVREDPDSFTLEILSYLQMLGYFPITSWGDEENRCINIEGSGLRSEMNNTTLVLDQDYWTTVEKVLSGSVVHFDDGMDKPLVHLQIELPAKQNLNGYDEPWLAGERNLFDAASISNDNHYIKAIDGAFGTPSTSGVLWRSTDYIPVTPGDVLYFGEDIPVTTSAGTAFYNSSKEYISGVSDGSLLNAGGLATVPDNAAYMRHSFRVDGEYNSDWQNELYITLDSNAHEWMPYENICPIVGYTSAKIYRSGEDTSSPDEFQISWQTGAGTVYGGSLDVVTGILTIDHAYRQFDGTENWKKMPTSGNSYFYCVLGELNSGVTDSGICSHFAAADIRAVTSEIGHRIVNSSSGDFRLCIRPENCDSYTKDTFRSWVAEQAQKGTPLEIVWELAVPQTYRLSPIQIKSLVGANNIWANTGDILSLTYLSEGFVHD